jgi:Cu(I)/Ag(I) efflux system membrane fusion protein
VIEKSVHEQQYVKEGDMLYRIADLDPIWLYLEIYEYDQGWVRYGQAVDVTLEAYPGESFRGIVTFIDPFLDDKTRTVKARVNLKNPEHKLKPAMYASASIRVRLLADGTPEPTGLEGKYICRMHPEVIRDEPGRCPICAMVLDRVPGVPAPAPHEVHDRPDRGSGKTGVLAVPTSAVLDTGRRKVVYRQTKAGNYELAEIRLGPRAEAEDESGKRTGYYPVLSGLKPGDRVVVRGGFLLDSQTQIEGRPSLLYPEGQGPAALHSGHGGAAPPQKPASGEHKH